MYYEPIRDIDDRVTAYSYNNCTATLHYHETIEIIFIFNGNLLITSGQKQYNATCGDVMFIPSFFPHSVTCSQDSFSTTVMIPKKYFEKINFGNKIFALLSDKEKNKQLFDLRSTLCLSVNTQSENEILGYVIVLLAAIERLYPATAIENKDKNLLIIEIIRYINDNFRDNITLDIISEHFGYSKYYFSRFFNKHFNCNLNTYLGGIRLKTAENLILKGINVTDAVITSGINSLSTYYRLKRQNQRI